MTINLNKQKDHLWGDYYFQGKRPRGRQAWALEILHTLNMNIPTFNEIFDEETFYVFVVCFVIATILVVIFLAKVVGIEIKEHNITINRDWGSPRPANPFQFPWKIKKE
ncbi:hypothetical protein WR25_17293 [Diploscapter pachys]|uniref:Uncharacterized protein n=1 Tax=Diploscapter pachys TaxID=2018661 RepID=A0A2A2KS78_9BILA|nr:hypothetical protein WR25_17293 [Diploscapter pachys]